LTRTGTEHNNLVDLTECNIILLT